MEHNLATSKVKTGANLAILALPFEAGAGRRGCAGGPDALLRAGLADALSVPASAVTVLDQFKGRQEIRVDTRLLPHPNKAITALEDVVAAISHIHSTVAGLDQGICPVFVGGDHAIAAGTLPALAQRATLQGRPLFVLWLDAHPDFHTLSTTISGNLHGVPLAYATGQSGFAGYYPEPPALVDPSRLCLLGIRSVDAEEQRVLARARTRPLGMKTIIQHGMATLVSAFLEKVRNSNGLLHVSFDVDWLDPALAPAVGTPVANGVTLDQAHIVMDLLRDSGLVSSLDLVEYNPELDQEGRTARTVIDLVVRLFTGCDGIAGLKAA